ncbi:hypothetical protein PVAND_008914 [Polypedilum vanderplanki]|uniref:Secreted protein n=1 Tax=Polypedilum vanderplanki TaxID=319348 RepID=A0A9J6CCJ0_POLVA|nr:hypothetical protein PVAND_008914 [Polypedilum vanderplanki]
MKFVVGILVACFAFGVNAQDGALTERLLSAQGDLSLTHELFETIMGINRGQLSAYIYRVTRVVLESHLDSYEFIFTNGADARAQIEALTPGNDAERACVERFQRRFELQKQRLGQGLARCVQNVQNVLLTWNSFTNNAHENGQVLAAQVQNIGFSMFAQQQLYDGPEDFPAMINRELWNAIVRILDVVDSVEEFIRNISIDLDNIQIDFVRCDRELEERALSEIEAELTRARACVGQGPTDPNPTK